MEEWLKDLWNKFKEQKIGILILFALIALIILNLVTVISDIGFSEEVKNNRFWILASVIIASIVIVYFLLYKNNSKKILELSDELRQANIKNSKLEEGNRSVLRLMELYKEEAQENIFKKLKQLATFSIRQKEWQNKGAKIETFRVEEFDVENNLDSQLAVAEFTTVLINLGTNDNILEGMRFIIQDPHDSKKYGRIVVKESSDTGSACKIVEMSHQAFWYEIVQEIEKKEGKGRILTASANIILPDSPFRDINVESAKELLDWLQTLENIEL